MKLLTAFMAAVVGVAATPVAAEEGDWSDAHDDSSITGAHLDRRYGLGTGLGRGFAAAYSPVLGPFGPGPLGTSGSLVFSIPPTPAVLLPTFEARFFLRDGHSLDLSVPLVSAVVASINRWAFVGGFDASYVLNFGGERFRFYGGLGLGLGVVLGLPRGAYDVELRVPLTTGVEYLTAGHGFGIGVQARPLMNLNIEEFVQVEECMFGCGGSPSETRWNTTTFGAGLLGVLSLTWYATTK